MTAPTKSDDRAWRALYGTLRWKAIREDQLNAEPLCERCIVSGIVELATVVHHKTPHRGNLDLFWAGPFESLCKPHHDSHGQLEDHGKRVILFDEKGWPI